MRRFLVEGAAFQRIVFFVTVTAALLSVSLLAQGEDKKEAKRFFDNGNSLFIEGRYMEAASAFQSSVDLYPTVSG